MIFRFEIKFRKIELTFYPSFIFFVNIQNYTCNFVKNFVYLKHVCTTFAKVWQKTFHELPVFRERFLSKFDERNFWRKIPKTMFFVKKLFFVKRHERLNLGKNFLTKHFNPKKLLLNHNSHIFLQRTGPSYKICPLNYFWNHGLHIHFKVNLAMV